ncbi:MAG TPA: hypothetical protein VIN75_12515 [Burkholderiaceae bacterium]
MLKSILVVASSYVLSVVLVLCSDPLLTALFPGDFVSGHVPSDKALVASTALFVAISLSCAWLCARFSPRPTARRVLAFMILGELMGLGATIPHWSTDWPHWYWLSWLISWPISCYVGWRIEQARSAPTAVAA